MPLKKSAGAGCCPLLFGKAWHHLFSYLKYPKFCLKTGCGLLFIRSDLRVVLVYFQAFLVPDKPWGVEEPDDIFCDNPADNERQEGGYTRKRNGDKDDGIKSQADGITGHRPQDAQDDSLLIALLQAGKYTCINRLSNEK